MPAPACNWLNCICRKTQSDLAKTELNEVLADDRHAPAFQRRRERVWVRKAKALLRKIG